MIVALEYCVFSAGRYSVTAAHNTPIRGKFEKFSINVSEKFAALRPASAMSAVVRKLSFSPLRVFACVVPSGSSGWRFCRHEKLRSLYQISFHLCRRNGGAECSPDSSFPGHVPSQCLSLTESEKTKCSNKAEELKINQILWKTILKTKLMNTRMSVQFLASSCWSP